MPLIQRDAHFSAVDDTVVIAVHNEIGIADLGDIGGDAEF